MDDHGTGASTTSEAAETPAGAEMFKAAGNKLFRLQAYKQAVVEYTKAVQADPQNAVYISNRCAAYMAAHMYQPALKDARVALSLDGQNPKTLLRMARIYTALGQPLEAMETLKLIAPPVAHKDQAPAMSMLEHVRQAERYLQDESGGSMMLHALDQAERNLGVGVKRPRRWQLIRGEAHLKIGTMTSAADALEAATYLLRLNSQDTDALVLRGRAMYTQGEHEKAIQHFRQALSYEPDMEVAVRWLRKVQKIDKLKEEGNVAFKAGRLQEAIEIYSAALDVDPANKCTNSRLLHNRALAAVKVKKLDAALADCSRALELDPSYVKPRKTRARAFGEAGSWEEAVREYRVIAKLNPFEPNISKDIKWAELELKKSQRKDFYKVLGVDKDAGDQDIRRAYRKLAIIHHPDKNRDNEQADAKFKEIGEAYETLSDPQKRSRFDSSEDLIDVNETFSSAPAFGEGGMQIDPEMLFNMMGGRGGGNTFSFSAGGGPLGGRSNPRASGGFPPSAFGF